MQKVWVVTGASRGIGAAVAHEAARRGGDVVLVARSDAVNNVAGAITATGASVHVIQCDITDEGVPERIAAETVDRFGRIDVLVNNAAIHRGGRIEKLSIGDFDAVLSANLRAPYLMCAAAVPRMMSGSAIVNVGAVVGMRGFPGDSAYGSSKGGVAALTQVLAVELGSRGITVNLVVPGFTETELTGSLRDDVRERLRGMIPLKRTAQPEEIASVVAWVAESAYMTGAAVPVDGGLMATFGGG
jgi:3-oxoacyl-[acyl-carrier protein] reductase